MPPLSYQARLALSPPASHRVQCNEMKSNERTTLYVDFSHVQDHNTELADAIEADFHYLEPFLRQALKNLMKREHEEYATDDKDFWVCFFNMQTQLNIRDLKTAKIARLMSFAGTVTRTSEVRPELIEGVFMCETCAAAVHTVVSCRLRRAAAGPAALGHGPSVAAGQRLPSITQVRHQLRPGAAAVQVHAAGQVQESGAHRPREGPWAEREGGGGGKGARGEGDAWRVAVRRAGSLATTAAPPLAWPPLLGPL